jgi:hypothetical protein
MSGDDEAMQQILRELATPRVRLLHEVDALAAAGDAEILQARYSWLAALERFQELKGSWEAIKQVPDASYFEVRANERGDGRVHADVRSRRRHDRHLGQEASPGTAAARAGGHLMPKKLGERQDEPEELNDSGSLPDLSQLTTAWLAPTQPLAEERRRQIAEHREKQRRLGELAQSKRWGWFGILLAEAVLSVVLAGVIAFYVPEAFLILPLTLIAYGMVGPTTPALRHS